ncbi:MAG TPA: OB-fold nucleic acid binding domain-containing protein [Acidimicrobiia bacterium]|nr:OB-fold nucleic acid binding domain-containing protein [Acidimicrobiia bacterium]
MALGKTMKRLTKPVDELDREALGAYCDRLGVTPMDRITPRTPTRVAGEIRAVRIVPRAGAPAVEVTVSDGRGSVVGVFLGRRKIPGMSPGRRVMLAGVAGKDGNRYLVYNPEYQLLG